MAAGTGLARGHRVSEAAGGRPAPSARWPVVLAWASRATATTSPAILWSDRLLRQAVRPDLVQVTAAAGPGVLAVVSAATVGGALASRRPRQQVDLDALTRELLAVVDQTMQPSRAALWIRPPDPPSPKGTVTR